MTDDERKALPQAEYDALLDYIYENGTAAEGVSWYARKLCEAYGRVKIYYAHSVAIYGRPQELRDIETLQALGFEVVNPNAPEHDAGYHAGGMAYFDAIVAKCDALAFRAHADGSIPAGVAKEVECMRGLGRPVIELPTAVERRVLSVDATRAYLRESGAR